MTAPRPRIGITARVTGEGQRRHTGVHIDYAHSVAGAGAIPLLLPPAMGPETAADALAGCDGLLLTGGEDLHPESFGQATSEHVRDTDPQRDAVEVALFRTAWDRRLPTLAICRGFQLMNVALGGTLWHDLPAERAGDLAHDSNEPWDHRSHEVTIAEGSRVLRAVERSAFVTNSFHHQAIRRLAPGLVATAWTEDGVIEAAERDDPSHWLVGVQWHPESFWQEEDAPESGLFRALVTQAGLSASGRALQFTQDPVG